MASKHLTEDEIRYTVDVKTAAAQKEIYRLEQQSKKLRSENKARLSQMIQLEAAGKKRLIPTRTSRSNIPRLVRKFATLPLR